MTMKHLAIIMTAGTLLIMSLGAVQHSKAASFVSSAGYDSSNTPEPPPLIPGSEIRFERYSADQGLSMSVVNAIAQDRQGFLWLGTQDGLNRFDGKKITIIKRNPQDPNSLSANWIEALFVDSDGDLWIGTDGGGLDRYDPIDGSFTHYRRNPDDPSSLTHNTVYAIEEDQTGGLWIGTGSGLDRLDRQTGKFTHLHDDRSAPEILQSGEIKTIREDSDGNLWVGTNEGLVKRETAAQKYTHFKADPNDPGSLKSDMITAIVQDHLNRLWIGTNGGGLNLLQEDQSFKQFLFQDKSNSPSNQNTLKVFAIYPDEFGRLLVGTWGSGLYLFDPESGKSIHYQNELGNPNSLSENYVKDIFKDRSGSIWIGTFGGGASKFDESTLRFLHFRKKFDNENSLSSNLVWSVFAENESIWVGTDNGLDRLDRSTGSVTHFRHDEKDPHSLPGNRIQAIFRDIQGALWIGTGGWGLSRYDETTGEFTNFTENPKEPGSLGSGGITAIAQDPDGNIWAGTKNGLSKYNRASNDFTTYYSDPDNPTSLDSSAIICVVPAQNGKLWVGTATGLNLFDPRTGLAERLPILSDIDSYETSIGIMAVLEDDSGVVWLGTIGRGMIRYLPSSGESKYYYEKDGLPNDTVYGIIQDKFGYIWMSTNNGLGRFDPDTEEFQVYDARDGLQANEFNSFAYYQSVEGELFFGGINGLSVFQPGEIQKNSYIPPIALVSLTSNGSSDSLKPAGNGLGPVRFEWPENSFEFEFSALSFVQPEDNQYAYLLENFDEKWNSIGTKNFGRYTNLPGGEYILRLRASNNDGVWNEDGRAIRIRVVPPLWQTLGFRLGLAALGLLIVFAGYRWRVNSVLNRSRQLETLVQERTREIENRRQELVALYSADEALYRNLHMEQVLEALVESAVRLLHADKGSLLVLDKETSRLTAHVTLGFKPTTVEKMNLEIGDSIAGLVARTGEPYLVPDVRLEPLVSRAIVEPEGIQSLMQVPIKVGGEVFGVFSADFVEPHSFGDDELRLLISLSQRAAQAIQNALIYEQTQEKAVIEERNRLARELHDAVTQTLFSASLIAEALPTAYDADPQEARQLLSELRQLNRGALAEMRALLMELRPSALSEANLEDLLRQLGEAAAGREGIPVKVLTNGHIDLPPDVHIALYRIAQEALNNALKHARAKQITIKLATNYPVMNNSRTELRKGVQLIVSDDGRGFDPENTPSNHLGLKIMRERAAAIDAHLCIESKEGKGTRVTILWENNQYN